MALLYTLPTGRPIWGLATLGNEQYVVRAGSSDIEVYNYASLQRRLTVSGLINARDMAACEQHQCLYVTDIGGQGFIGYAVHRISVADARVTTWPLDDKPWGVTVTADCTVLVTCSEPAQVLEYTTHGRLLREIQLPPEVVHPLHATRLFPVHGGSSGVEELIVCHGDGNDEVHSVSAFRTDADGSSVVSRAVSDLQDVATGPLDVPGHLVLDGNTGTILVADINNSRIVMTSPRLDRLKVVMELDQARQYPVRLCLDQQRGRLYVAVNGDVRNGRWKSGCVYAFFVYFGASFSA